LKLKIQIFFSIALLSFVFFAPAKAQEVAIQEQVKSLDSTLKIQTNGSVNVTETIIYDFGPNQKHGIFRDIPTTFHTAAGTLKTRISQISVIDSLGQLINFTTSYPSDETEIKIGDASKLIDGVKTYIISYQIDRVINFFNDHDELYWNVTGNYWNVLILSSSASVILPGQIQADKITIKCYAGALGSTVSCDQQSAGNSSATFSQGNLPVGGGLTIVVGFPKGLVTQPTQWQKIQQFILDNAIAGVPIIVFIVMFLLWWNFGRDPKSSNVVVAEYEAPEGLSPSEVLEMVKFNEPSRGITAEIIELAVLGYLKINRVETKVLFSTQVDYELTQLKTSESLTKEHQKTLLDGLFVLKGAGSRLDRLEANAPKNFLATAAVGLVKTVLQDTEPKMSSPDSVMLSGLRDIFYHTLDKVKKQITKSLIDQKYLAHDPVLVKVPYIVISAMLFFASFFIAGIYGAVGLVSLAASGLIVLLFGLVMPRRTVGGTEIYRRILGLKLYLNVAEKDRMNFHDAPEKSPKQFEQLLPYAIALGVEKQWAKQFEGIYLTPPSWYGSNYSNFNTLLLINSLNEFHSSSSSSLASRPSSNASSGGSGFSGGGSGGGFGGGGGGSW
jgi:uncharacterized membrane protein